ncbi:peptide ABC transporter substrate-binding protein, partial [Oenococcus oeni]
MARKKKMSTSKKVAIAALALVIVVGGIFGFSALLKNSSSNTNVLNEYLGEDMTTQDLSQMTDSYAF